MIAEESYRTPSAISEPIYSPFMVITQSPSYNTWSDASADLDGGSFGVDNETISDGGYVA